MEDEEIEALAEIERLNKIKEVEKIGRVLGYGISENIFAEKFNVLPADKKEILERIAERLETITTLGYESYFLRNPYKWNFQFIQWELPSIQVYLYCTCMDTLAGKVKYLKFHEWLKTQDLSNLHSMKIDEYYKNYNKTEGNREGFKRLFNDLSPNIKMWLNTNIAIQKSNEYQVSSTERNQDDFIRRLTEYFYTYWRNSFTHNSVTKPIDTFGLDRLRNSSDTESEWHRESTGITFGGSNTEWSLWHKKELDILLIIRIIIHSVVFQWLDIEISDELINENVYRLQRLYWIYEYLHEIRENAYVLDLWKEVEGDHIQKFIPGSRSSGQFGHYYAELPARCWNFLLGIMHTKMICLIF